MISLKSGGQYNNSMLSGTVFNTADGRVLTLARTSATYGIVQICNVVDHGWARQLGACQQQEQQENWVKVPSVVRKLYGEKRGWRPKYAT